MCLADLRVTLNDKSSNHILPITADNRACRYTTHSTAEDYGWKNIIPSPHRVIQSRDRVLGILDVGEPLLERRIVELRQNIGLGRPHRLAGQSSSKSKVTTAQNRFRIRPPPHRSIGRALTSSRLVCRSPAFVQVKSSHQRLVRFRQL